MEPRFHTVYCEEEHTYTVIQKLYSTVKHMMVVNYSSRLHEFNVEHVRGQFEQVLRQGFLLGLY